MLIEGGIGTGWTILTIFEKQTPVENAEGTPSRVRQDRGRSSDSLTTCVSLIVFSRTARQRHPQYE